jgi:hypothetical protein
MGDGLLGSWPDLLLENKTTWRRRARQQAEAAMADRVREVMESMVPEFEDMQRRRLCTASEVRQLAQTRKRFEYLVHR